MDYQNETIEQETRRVLIRHASRYQFEDRATGRKVDGCRVQYDAGVRAEASDNRRGCEVAEAKLPYAAFEKLSPTLPAFHEIIIDTVVVKGEVKRLPVDIKGICSPSDAPAGNGARATAAAKA